MFTFYVYSWSYLKPFMNMDPDSISNLEMLFQNQMPITLNQVFIQS